MRPLLVFILLFFIFSSVYAQPDIDMQLQLEKGRTYFLFTKNTVTIIETTEDGTATKTVNIEEGGFSYKVLEDLDSLYLMETSFTFLKTRAATDTGIITAGSSEINNHNDVLSTILRNITNKPFRVLFRKADYNWEKIEGLDSIFLNSYNEYDLNEDVKRRLDSSMKESMKDFLRQDVALTAAVSSTRKMASDRVWTTYTVAEHVVPTIDSCTYYFSETTGDFITIKGEGTVTSLEEETMNEDASVSYHLKGPLHAIVKFYRSNGWIGEATLQTEISGNAIIKDSPLAEKRTVKMQIITESTISGY